MESISGQAAVVSKPERGLGLITVILLALGNTIGGGIFVLIAPGAALTGMFLPVSFLLGGILAYLMAFVFAETSASVSKAGSYIVFIFRAFGKGAIPFILAWLIVLGNVSYGAINAFAFTYYFGTLLPYNAPIIISIFVVFFAFIVNVRGAGRASTVEAAISLALLGLLAMLIYFLFSWDGAPDTAMYRGIFGFPILGILSGTALTFTTFIGFESVAKLAGEIKNPERNIPRALFITVFIATIIYTTIAFGVVNSVPFEVIASSDVPLLAATEYLGFGALAKFIVIPAALLATLGSLFVAVLVASLDLFAIASEGFLPQFFASRNRRGVPMRALAVSAAAVLVVVALASVEFAAYTGTAVYLIIMIAISFALLAMREKRPFLVRPFAVPRLRIPLIVVGCAGAVLLSISLSAMFFIVVWSLIGFFLFLLSQIDRNRIRWVVGGAIGVLLLFAAALVALFAQ